MVATIIICIVIAGIIVLGLRHYQRIFRSGCCGSDSDPQQRIKVQDRDLNHYPYAKVLDINGMTCQNCVTHVHNALNSLQDVYAQVNLGQKKAVVHMKEELSDQVLRKTVAAAGYTVETVRTVSGNK